MALFREMIITDINLLIVPIKKCEPNFVVSRIKIMKNACSFYPARIRYLVTAVIREGQLNQP